MSLQTFEYTKKWTNPEDFPTYEADEATIRADMQSLPDEVMAALNTHIGEDDAEHIPFTPTAAIQSSTVQNAIENVQAQIDAAVTGELPDNSITNEKLKDASSVSGEGIETGKIKDGAITAGKIADDAVTAAKIADGSVQTAAIANGAVTNDKIANGTIMAAKIASGQVATLSEGIIPWEQRRKKAKTITANYTLTAADAGKVLYITAPGVTITLPNNTTANFPLDAEIEIVRSADGVEPILSYAQGVAVRNANPDFVWEKFLAIRLRQISANIWYCDGDTIHTPGFVSTDLLASGAVTAPKIAASVYGSGTPAADGSGSAGTAATLSRSDHVHPTDTSRAAAADLSSHTSAANPHSGSASTGDLSALASAVSSHTEASNPHSGSASTGDLSALASAVSSHIEASNPHSGSAAASDLSALESTVASHTGDTSNPHNVTRAQLSVTEQGKLKIGDTEYTLQIGAATDAAAGYITFVLE